MYLLNFKLETLQSSLYNGLLFFGLVEVFGMHFSLISISEDEKSAIRSVESERDLVVKAYILLLVF